jgi:hypothetical protein
MQGGLDWEMIAMVAAIGSAAVIAWDGLTVKAGERSDARKGILEVAWPVLFIAVMGCSSSSPTSPRCSCSPR